MAQSKSTKDKYVIVPRLEKLTALMNEYFGVNNEVMTEDEVHEEVTEVIEADDSLGLIKSVNPDATSEDIEEYGEYVDSVVRISSPLYHQCHNALLAITAYVYKNNTDKEFAEWVDDYANNTYEFSNDQIVNYNNIKVA